MIAPAAAPVASERASERERKEGRKEDSVTSPLQVLSYPFVLGLNVESNVVPTLDYLESRLCLSTRQLRKVVTRSPPALGLSVEKNLGPTLAFLETRLDLDDDALRKLVVSTPNVLMYSVRDNLGPKLDFLEGWLDGDDRGGTPRSTLARVVTKLPQALGLSVENNLKPKLAFFEDAMGPREARTFVADFPAALSRSLDRRLLPRANRLTAAGVHLDKTTMAYVCVKTDAAFLDYLAKCEPLEFMMVANPGPGAAQAT